MIEKSLLRKFLSQIKSRKLKVVYWDNKTETYGDSGPLIGTLTIHDQSALGEIARELDLGFGEAYMNGKIDFDGDLRDLVVAATENANSLSGILDNNFTKALARGFSKSTSVNEQRNDIHHHYDLGNDFFKLFLDPSMTYSCAYYKTKTDDLETAQKQKVDHILKKLRLEKGETLLDIGSGWGELILRAANEYGVNSHGITMSSEQVVETKARTKKSKLEKQVSVELSDYRDHAKKITKGKNLYDKIVSVGMFEHVGRPNLSLYIQAVSDMLKPGGLALIHFISQWREEPGGRFTTRYIFPGGYIPSLRETIALMPDAALDVLDVENLRLHYSYTLEAWAKNFENNLDNVRSRFADRERLGERWSGKLEAEKFIRMWRLYLRGSSAGFLCGNLDLHQILVSKGINNALPLTRVA